MHAFSYILSLVALFLSGFTFWYCYWRRGEVQGCFSYIEIPICLIDGISKKEMSLRFTPYFFLKNVGARSIIIEGIKLRFSYNGVSFCASPICTDDGNKSSKFVGIVLSPNEDWSSNLTFEMQSGCQFKDIGEHECIVTIEIKPFCQNDWEEIETNHVKFKFTQDELLIEKFNYNKPRIYKFFLNHVSN